MYIDKPNVPMSFFYGNIVSWKVPTTIKKDRGKYCVTMTMTFASGKTVTKQYGTCKTEQEARTMIDIISNKLYTKTFVPFVYSCAEYLRYWLYWVKVDEIQYNTYFSYRNVVENYLIPYWGEQKKIDKLTTDDILKMLKDLELSPSQFQQMKGVLYSAFKYARINNIIAVNPVPLAIKIFYKKYIGTSTEVHKKNIYNKEQLVCLLQSARGSYIFCPLMLSIAAGLRVSEALAVRVQGLDIQNKMLLINEQVGRSLNGENELMLKKPKSKSGIRKVPLADWVIDELILANKRNEEYFTMHPELTNYGFFTINAEGKAFSRSQIYREYKKIIEKCGLPYLNWHSLRHAYSTLLSEDGMINIKSIKETMGHSKCDMTKSYIYEEVKVYDTSVVMNDYIEAIKPCQTTTKIYDLTKVFI